MMQNQGRANTGLQAQLGFLNPVQNALGMQQWATNAAESYKPLQTGGTSTESTGGLGTWLPQVLGAGLGAVTGGLGGGGFMGASRACPEPVAVELAGVEASLAEAVACPLTTTKVASLVPAVQLTWAVEVGVEAGPVTSA